VVKSLSYCPKCGAKLEEDVSFCPKCGAPVKMAQTTAETRPTAYRRGEKSEKSEKAEKHEKGEKREKHELGFFGPLIGGLILIFLGVAAFVGMEYPHYNWRWFWAFFLILFGVIVIIAAIYVALVLGKRHPKP
jgi:cation transport ATPase